jgi:hypothetical protein
LYLLEELNHAGQEAPQVVEDLGIVDQGLDVCGRHKCV